MTRILLVPLALHLLPSYYLKFLLTHHAAPSAFNTVPPFIQLTPIQLTGYSLPDISSRKLAPLWTFITFIKRHYICLLSLYVIPWENVFYEDQGHGCLVHHCIPSHQHNAQHRKDSSQVLIECMETEQLGLRSSGQLYKPFFMHKNTLIYLPLQLPFQPMIRSKTRNYFHSGSPLIQPLRKTEDTLNVYKKMIG